jgi:hypothetical protein
MEQFKTKVKVKKDEVTRFDRLPRTPFFIQDNESFEQSVYMVVESTDGKYTYVNMEDGRLVGTKDNEDYILNRINSGSDTLLLSEVNLSKWKF